MKVLRNKMGSVNLVTNNIHNQTIHTNG